MTELPKKIAGLGIGSILHMNIALIFKWWWKFLEETSPLWKRLVCSVHDIVSFKANLNSFKNCKWGISGQFKLIQKKWANVTSIVEEGLMNKIGKGDSLRFWDDVWIQSTTLNLRFPWLFFCVYSKRL